jgi:DNA/RNA endonuclease YhcR with UshA esterase domain
MFTTIRSIDNIVIESETDRKKVKMEKYYVLDGFYDWFCHLGPFERIDARL